MSAAAASSLPAASAAGSAVAKGKGTSVAAKAKPTAAQLALPKSADDLLGDSLQRMEDAKRAERVAAARQRKSSAAAAAKLAKAQLRAHELGKAAGQNQNRTGTGKADKPEAVVATPPVTAPSSPNQPAAGQQFGGKRAAKGVSVQ